MNIWDKTLAFIVILFIACIMILILRPFSCDSQPVSLPEYNYTPDLLKAGYVETGVAKQPILPDTLSHIKPWVEQTVAASGYWIPDTVYTPDDTLSIEASGIEMEDGTKWIRIEIENKPVKIVRADWFEKEPELGKWSAGVETAILHDFDIGLFASYNLFEVWDIRGGAAIAVDLNTDLSESPDWIALEGRLSTTLWRSVEAGGGIGVHLTKNAIDLHASAGLEIRF